MWWRLMFLFILLCTCSAIIDKLLVFHAYYFLCYVLTYFRPVHASSNYIFGAHLLGKPITHLIDRHDRCHRHEIFWKNVLSKLALCNTKKKYFDIYSLMEWHLQILQYYIDIFIYIAAWCTQMHIFFEHNDFDQRMMCNTVG